MLINCLANNTVLSAADSSVLATIACMDPIVHGSAVYQARAILDVDGGCETANHNMHLTSDREDVVINSGIDQPNEFLIRLYPNPNNGKFVVSSTNEIAEVKIFDIAGKLVYSALNPSSEIESNLHTGIYIVHFTNKMGKVNILKIEVF